MSREQRKKTALVLSGGGATGAYEVGVIKALVAGRSPSTGFQPLEPDAFLGNSIGCFNATMLVSGWDRYGPASASQPGGRLAQPAGEGPGPLQRRQLSDPTRSAPLSESRLLRAEPRGTHVPVCPGHRLCGLGPRQSAGPRADRRKRDPRRAGGSPGGLCQLRRLVHVARNDRRADRFPTVSGPRAGGFVWPRPIGRAASFVSSPITT